jgi:serine/threonine protein kinase
MLHLRYDIYNTTNPHIYRRAPIVDSDDEKTPERAQIVNEIQPDARLLLFLTSELGQGNTGVVHGGVLEVETENKKSRLSVAAKLSFSDEQRDRLQEEWYIYMHLMSEGVEGIPPLLGIFYDPETVASPLCLLTCHAGVSLARSGESITSTQRYKFPITLLWRKRAEKCYRNAFLAVLQSIHGAGVQHGDLRYDNLLVKDSGEVAIIDFDRARRNTRQSSRKEEYHALMQLLDNRVDDSKLAVKIRTRTRKERENVEVRTRITRSMGTVRQTLGGMTLRPRR